VSSIAFTREHGRIKGPNRVWAAVGLICLLIISLQVILRLLGTSTAVPASWNVHLDDQVNSVQDWIQDHRRTSLLFTGFLGPISSTMKAALSGVENVLLWLPWFSIPAIGMAIVARRDQVRRTIITGIALAYPAFVGLWEPSMQTMALMLVSVAVSVLLGVPLGIASGLSRRVDRIVRPTLDAMQTIPATVYLIPIVLLFGIGAVPAALATVIYALPPVVRLTALGISEVPDAMVEAGRMFGSSRRQLLTKVQLPTATPSILTGINQTINMALGIVVIASLVGAGGLGQRVIVTLNQRSPGRGLAVGLAIVAIAIALDRITRSFIHRGNGSPAVRSWSFAVGVGGLILTLIIVGRLTGKVTVPFTFDDSSLNPIDDGVIWFRNHVSGVTRWINDTIVREVLVRSKVFLNSTVVWPVSVAFAATIAYTVRGWKLALFTVVGLVSIGLVGMWAYALETLVQTIVAVVVSAVIAIPIGIWAGRSPRIESAISPVLDALQTIPSLIYTIPFVMLFTVSPVPGIIASVIYAIPAGIRIAALGIRGVDDAPLEASRSFGATTRQTVWGVSVPLALPTIILAINQVIMMVLAMVIIAGMVGGGGLGFQAVTALTRSDSGLGAEVAVSIVVMAVILDRLTQGLADKARPVKA
jgi:glycine betaine/proline transport system permease protein